MNKKTLGIPLWTLFGLISLTIASTFFSNTKTNNYDLRSHAESVSTSPSPTPMGRWVHVDSPNGGETLTVGQTYRIKWSNSVGIDKVYIGYSSCPSCLDDISPGLVANTGYYDWKVFVGNTANTQFKINIIAYQTGVGSVQDYSDNNFTVRSAITPTPTSGLSLRIVSPNGGQTVTVGQTYRISWSNSVGIDKVMIGYSSCPSCLSWITNNGPIVNTGYYDWRVFVGNTTNTQFKIYVLGYKTTGGSGQVSDYSDNFFTVKPAMTPTPTPGLSVRVVSPNGGETLTVGQTYRITWANSPTINVVTLGYSSGPGNLSWIANNIPNTGYYDWKVNVGNTTNTQFKINVIAYQTGVGSTQDYSDNYFTVKPAVTPTPTLTASLTLITPNGGEIWKRGSAYKITWTQPTQAGSTGLFLYTRNLSGTDSYLGAIAYYVSNLVGQNTYSWTIPSTGGSATTPPDGNNIIIEVCQYDASGNRIVCDKSNSPFTVTSSL